MTPYGAGQGGGFLTATWRHLLMLNYVVDPALLRGRVPAGTELDQWNEASYVSVVGFRFLNTRVGGLPVPMHRDFEEVNLRFYVRRRSKDRWRRGVVFIREIVPRRAIAAVARLVYEEPYVALPMRHRVAPDGDDLLLEYAWRRDDRWERLSGRAVGVATVPSADSEAGFITEHYWGYTARRNGASSEYRVSHAPWAVRPVREAALEADVTALYGAGFAESLRAAPRSAFLAEGSDVTVYGGRTIGEAP